MTFHVLLAKHKMELDRVTKEFTEAKEEIERLNKTSSSELPPQGIAVDEVLVRC